MIILGCQFWRGFLHSLSTPSILNISTILPVIIDDGLARRYQELVLIVNRFPFVRFFVITFLMKIVWKVAFHPYKALKWKYEL